MDKQSAIKQTKRDRIHKYITTLNLRTTSRPEIAEQDQNVTATIIHVETAYLSQQISSTEGSHHIQLTDPNV